MVSGGRVVLSGFKKTYSTLRNTFQALLKFPDYFQLSSTHYDFILVS
jgi:hypothetical protein